MIKVLIADDQKLIRQSLEIVLNSREGIKVIDVASDGQQVIRSIRREKPDTDGHPYAENGRRFLYKDYQRK